MLIFTRLDQSIPPIHSANIFSIIYTGVCEKNAIFHYFF